MRIFVMLQYTGRLFFPLRAHNFNKSTDLLKRINIGLYPLYFLVPPLERSKLLNCFLIESIADKLGWHATNNGVGRYITRNNRTRRNNGSVPYGDAIHQQYFLPYPDIISYFYFPAVTGKGFFF